MLMPYMDEIQSSRDMVTAFRGYNHNDVISVNEFYDMQNMTVDFYPAISVRSPRKEIRILTKCNGIFAKGCLYFVDGTGFYGNDGNNGETVLRGSVTDSEKQFASMGAYLLIWPDKVFYNVTTHEFGDLEKSWTAGAEVLVSYTLVKYDPVSKTTSDYTEDIHVGPAAPEDPEDGEYWQDTSSTPQVLKRWSKSSAAWVSVPTTYVKVSAPGIGVGFSRYDGVKLSGSTNETFNATFVLQDVGENYITVIGLIDASFTQLGGLSVKREIPELDFITEANNRLWGCSSANHEIYACKLGDPFNWNCFEGISTDSYVATIGSDGDFTGAVTHMGYVLFFKEDMVHRIYGSKPANYQLSDVALQGVERGSEKSLQIVNSTLFYKSQSGIMIYDGGFPECISEALGPVLHSNAVAGVVGNKYYVSMQSATGTWNLFVFDTRKGVWTREDDMQALAFASVDGKLHFVDANYTLYTVTGSDSDEAIEWFLESGDFGDTTPDNKYISKLQLKLEMAPEAVLNLYIQYDSSGTWEQVGNEIGVSKKQIFTLPIIPRRCDHMRIKISGSGFIKLYSISKVMEQGSEL